MLAVVVDRSIDGSILMFLDTCIICCCLLLPPIQIGETIGDDVVPEEVDARSFQSRMVGRNERSNPDPQDIRTQVEQQLTTNGTVPYIPVCSSRTDSHCLQRGYYYASVLVCMLLLLLILPLGKTPFWGVCRLV